MQLTNKLIIPVAIVTICAWITFLITIRPYLSAPTPIGEMFTPIGFFIFACIIAPLWEELMYRHVPIQISNKITKASGQSFEWPIILLSSCIFGLSHNNGAYNIPLQGVCGLVLSLVYIHTGYKYWSSVIVHASWNFFALYILPYLQ